MKTFYTQRDIEEMHAAGITRIEIDENNVLTDLARETLDKLGILLVSAEGGSGAAVSSYATAKKPAGVDLGHADLASRIKAGVIARLGTNDYDHLLDQVIPQILARLESSSESAQAQPGSGSSQSDY